MAMILDVAAREILDSRGNPTVEVDVLVEGGIIGRAAAPSGASTGSHEAVELRDGDKSRFHGKGVEKAIGSVMGEIVDELIGMDVFEQIDIDRKMIALDDTPNKSRLGGNAMVATSMAVARAAAQASRQPLYRYLGGAFASTLPVPMMNIINGGAHGDNSIDIQEFMIIPSGASQISEAIRMGSEVFHSLKKLLGDAGHVTNVGDEGGFAPSLRSTNEALDFIMKAIEAAGYVPGKDVFLGLDVASSEFYRVGRYHMAGENKIMDSEQMVGYYQKLVNDYPIISIEDGMAEDDWHGWELLTKKLGDKIQLVGDDVFVTNCSRIREGIDRGVANSVLIKVNQIGTLTETAEAIDLAHKSGYTTIMSHRSGETEDSIIADLSVAFGTGQIKTGSLSRSDRVSKYNQLIRIAEELGSAASFGGVGARRVLL